MKGKKNKPSIENKKADSSKIMPPVKQPSDTPVKSETESKSDCTKESQEGILKKYIKSWLPTFFAAVMAYFAFQQTCISCNVASITKDATRPYLVVEDFKLRVVDIVNGIPRPFVVGKRFVIDFVIRNKGQTPAYKVVDFLQADILKKDAILPMPPTNISNQYIVGSEIKKFKQSERLYSKEDSIGINTKNTTEEHWVYFWGKIEYFDIAGTTYWTEFGYRYIFAHNNWFPYKEYNSAN